MNISVSNIMVTNTWIAFLSVLALIGIIVAGGFIVSLLGRMVLSVLFPPRQEDSVRVDEFGYVNSTPNSNQYIPQEEEYITRAQSVAASVHNPTLTEDDYSYAVDVDEKLARKEEAQLNKDLEDEDEDDFFNDFSGEDDVRFGDDDLMSMIDEISQDVLDEEEQSALETEKAESEANKSILDQYSIDDYFNESDEDDVVDEFDDIEPVAEENTINEFADIAPETEDEIETIVDQQTIDEINTLKQQVKEIVDNMEYNRSQSETFNEQLISILNELKEANKKEVKTEEDAEKEIRQLKQQLEDSRAEMEQQLQERIADKDAEMQQRLQDQLNASNVEIESLKEQLSELLRKMNEDEGEEPLEKEPVKDESLDEISKLRKEVEDMMASMKQDNETQNNINAQIVEILAEMKAANLKQSEQNTIKTNEDAIEQMAAWREELKITEKEIQERFKEEMLHKSENEKAELRAQMASYNDEIVDLKEQLSYLMQQFKNQKDENKVLIDQLEAERQERIRLQQEKTQAEKDSALTADELHDLYSESTTFDFYEESSFKQKIQEELLDSKQEIDELKEQLARLANYAKEREDSLAEQINVHEVRMAEFDINQIKEITVQEVEDLVRDKIIDAFAEIEILKDELNEAKTEIENQYKAQLANIQAGMEYERVNKLQDSAEKVDVLNSKLDEVLNILKVEEGNIVKTSEQCANVINTSRDEQSDLAKQGELKTSEVSVVGPKNNKVALVTTTRSLEKVETIDKQTAKQLANAEIDEIVAERLKQSNMEIESLKKEIASLKQDLNEKAEAANKVQSEVPVVRSPLFDVEMIKTITAKEVEKKVQERLAEAMKEIEAMKAQLELSKKEIERQYKEELQNNRLGESDVKDRLKGSAAEVIELKEQLIDLTEQIELEHQEAKQNSLEIAHQLGQDRKQKQEIAMQQLAIAEHNDNNAEVTVIGPKNNQVALVTGFAMLTEEVSSGVEDIPTIDIETVKQLTEQEIEEKVQMRMASSLIEIEELKKQILNLSIQIQEIKGAPDDDDEKPMVFHYATEEAYLERLAVLDERLKNAKKDLKINNKELNPLEKVKRTLERDKLKLRRKYAIVAKKKVALYGVNNYVDIDKDKAEKLAQELELLEGLKLSVNHCEEVMNANVDRYPILVHTNKILRENIANLESDVEELNKELAALRAKNGTEDNE